MQIQVSGDYAVNIVDADANFDWDDIEQVLISAAKTSSCPVCLSPPAAARVAKCGHVFCLPCILHHLALGEDPKAQWRDCPICGDLIYEFDLKSARLLLPFAITRCDDKGPLEHVAIGDVIEMCLVRRINHGMAALPLTDTWPVSDNHHRTVKTPVIPWSSTPDALNFARFMFASPEYMDGEYKRDLLELENALEEAKNWGATEELTYVYDSIQLVKDTMATHKGNAKGPAVRTHAMLPGATSSMKKEIWNTRAHMEDAKENEEVSFETAYYYFQAADGQNIYLQPLDIKILKHEFGDFELFPRHLQAIVTGVEEMAFTEDLRKKCKYLGHLPLTCDVVFVEIDLSGIVSKETLQLFDKELELRTSRRHENNNDLEAIKQTPAFQQDSNIFANDYPDETMDEDELLEYVLRMSAAEHQAQTEHMGLHDSTVISEEEAYNSYDGYSDDEAWDYNMARRRK
ncbi:hypothetical protein DFQ30_003649 [Apophysomyces sp. BC1015]|nr:hypothetical protein DFQ30_003649 [Apophysomyces sp. BC1015]